MTEQTVPLPWDGVGLMLSITRVMSFTIGEYCLTHQASWPDTSSGGDCTMAVKVLSVLLLFALFDVVLFAVGNYDMR